MDCISLSFFMLMYLGVIKLLNGLIIKKKISPLVYRNQDAFVVIIALC